MCYPPQRKHCHSTSCPLHSGSGLPSCSDTSQLRVRLRHKRKATTQRQDATGPRRVEAWHLFRSTCCPLQRKHCHSTNCLLHKGSGPPSCSGTSQIQEAQPSCRRRKATTRRSDATSSRRLEAGHLLRSICYPPQRKHCHSTSCPLHKESGPPTCSGMSQIQVQLCHRRKARTQRQDATGPRPLQAWHLSRSTCCPPQRKHFHSTNCPLHKRSGPPGCSGTSQIQVAQRLCHRRKARTQRQDATGPRRLVAWHLFRSTCCPLKRKHCHSTSCPLHNGSGPPGCSDTSQLQVRLRRRRKAKTQRQDATGPRRLEAWHLLRSICYPPQHKHCHSTNCPLHKRSGPQTCSDTSQIQVRLRHKRKARTQRQDATGPRRVEAWH